MSSKGQQIRIAMYWAVVMAEELVHALSPEDYADMIHVGGPVRQQKSEPAQ